MYPDEARKVLHPITLGDKQTQKDDIEFCKAFVKQLTEQKGQVYEREPDVHERHTDGP